MNQSPSGLSSSAGQESSPASVQQQKPQDERHRRSEKTQTAPSSGKKTGKRRKKKKSVGSIVQCVIISILLCALIVAAAAWGTAAEQLRKLDAQREEERIQYEKMVAAHQVLYRDYIERYAAQYELNPAFVAAIIKQESNYNPRAVSSKDARGLMQLMPNTFDWVRNNTGYRGADISMLFEPEVNIKMGCYLLRYIIDKMGTDDPVTVTCGYHAGWGTDGALGWVQKYSEDGKKLDLSQIPASDTRSYAGKVMNSYAIYLQHYY